MGNQLKKSGFALPAESLNTMSKSYPDRRTAQRRKRAGGKGGMLDLGPKIRVSG